MPALALGTVQFGLAYGPAAPSGPVPEAETRKILQAAWNLGIRRLDTAPAYGDIEERLDRLAGALPFSVVTKIPALPQALDPDEIRSFVRSSVSLSRTRLKERLAGILFHDADDLLGRWGKTAWEEACSNAPSLPLGPSCYGADTLDRIRTFFPVRMAQLPGNALDQGAARPSTGPDVEVTLRSLFLQGLLLMPHEQAVRRVPAAASALERWGRFCAENSLAPLTAALSIVKGFSGVQFCVVGVDSVSQIEEIGKAWEQAVPITAPWLDTPDTNVIDPRRWVAPNG